MYIRIKEWKKKRNGTKKGLNIHSYIHHKTYIYKFMNNILYELFIHPIHLYIILLFLYIQFMGSENVEIGSGASSLLPKAKL